MIISIVYISKVKDGYYIDEIAMGTMILGIMKKY
jgi:hypothetical protein